MSPKLAPVPEPESESVNSNASTGPRTPEGKAISSRNALRHGLASETMVFVGLGESKEEWESFRDAMFAEWLPTTPTEEALVGDMAKHQWLKDRAIRLQNDSLFHNLIANGSLQHFSVLLRYQTTNERAFARALKQLAEIRKNRQAEFVSQNAEAVPESSTAKAQKSRRRHEIARIDALTDAEVEAEVDETILAFGLGPVPSQMKN